MACGTLALQVGEQAAEGLTARLRQANAPRCKPRWILAPGLERCQAIWAAQEKGRGQR